MVNKKFKLIKHFEILFPSARTSTINKKPFTTVAPFSRKSYTPNYKSATPSHHPSIPKSLPKPPKIIVPYNPKFTKISEIEAQKIIQSGHFTGLDSISIKKIVIRHPLTFINAISQKLSDILLFPIRAGWSVMTPTERNALPWLETALEWGITSNELYENAHKLLNKHPLKNICLTSAKYMQTWEKQHKFLSWIIRDSKSLDRLLGQPVPIGSDGWPLNQLDKHGNEIPIEKLYEETNLLFHRISSSKSKSLKRLIQKIALQALQQGRISLVQNK